MASLTPITRARGVQQSPFGLILFNMAIVLLLSRQEVHILECSQLSLPLRIEL